MGIPIKLPGDTLPVGGRHGPESRPRVRIITFPSSAIVLSRATREERNQLVRRKRFCQVSLKAHTQASGFVVGKPTCRDRQRVHRADPGTQLGQELPAGTIRQPYVTDEHFHAGELGVRKGLLAGAGRDHPVAAVLQAGS